MLRDLELNRTLRLLLQYDGAGGDPIAVVHIAHPQLQEIAGS